MHYKKFFPSLLLILIIINSCDISKQVSELKTFSKCDFRLYTVEDIHLAGINIEEYNDYTDLNLLDIAKISSALAKGELPIDFTLNVQVKNPNATTAALNKMDWILFIDNIEILNGTHEQRTEIPANGGVKKLPLKIKADLNEVLTGKSAEAISNFAFNIAGEGNKPTNVLLKVKPTINAGGIPIVYPGYINVRNEFTSE
jgi:hypothetical protein